MKKKKKTKSKSSADHVNDLNSSISGFSKTIQDAVNKQMQKPFDVDFSSSEHGFDFSFRFKGVR